MSKKLIVGVATCVVGGTISIVNGIRKMNKESKALDEMHEKMERQMDNIKFMGCRINERESL